MTWKLRIWIAGLFVASLSWALFLVTMGVVYAEFGIVYAPGERTNPFLLEIIYVASFLLMLSSIVPGICFVLMGFRKEKAVTALRIWTFAFLITALISFNI